MPAGDAFRAAGEYTVAVKLMTIPTKSNASADGSTVQTGLSAAGAEVIDSAELAKRLLVPESWVRSHTNPHRTGDIIPHARLGRYIRFLWGSEELCSWLNRRLVSTNRAGHTRRNG